SMLATNLADCLEPLGRWDEAVRVSEDALATGPPPLYAAFLRLTPAFIAFRRGQAAPLEALMSPVTEVSGPPRDSPRPALALAGLRIERATADGALEPADRLLGEWLAREPDPMSGFVTMWLAIAGARLQRARRAAAPRDAAVAAAVAGRLTDLSELAGRT